MHAVAPEGAYRPVGQLTHAENVRLALVEGAVTAELKMIIVEVIAVTVVPGAKPVPDTVAPTATPVLDVTVAVDMPAVVTIVAVNVFVPGTRPAAQALEEVQALAPTSEENPRGHCVHVVAPAAE